MRFRHVMAALVPTGAAAALAIASAGASAAVGSPHYPAGHVTSAAAGRMIPAVSSPLAYKYEGKAHGSGALFSCQLPGAAFNCYTPQELATAYDVPSSLTGAGQAIVIIDAFGDPTINADLAVEDSAFGLPAANLKIIYPDGQPAFNPASADEVGWTGEIALDVESAHALAPAAAIDLVIAKSDQDPDILSALKYVVRNHLGSVLSQSYGEAESCEAPSIRRVSHRMFMLAARRHMSVFASSGDQGAAQPSCDGSTLFKSVEVPAADPAVTGVGATSLTASQPDGTYESETAWNDQFGASGGGYSHLFGKPFYQFGVAPGLGRGVPDVAYSGDVNNGLLIAWSQGDPAQVGSIYLFGGTSVGSPQWAAITALANEAVHRDLGFMNPRLYWIARTPAYHSAFHDITTGDNTISFLDSNNNTVTINGYPATTGWDPVTGLGTPDVARLIQALNAR